MPKNLESHCTRLATSVPEEKEKVPFSPCLKPLKPHARHQKGPVGRKENIGRTKVTEPVGSEKDILIGKGRE